MRTKRFILITVFSILFIASIVGLVFAFRWQHNLWLNEYNAQIAKFGFYKSDVTLLNQKYEELFNFLTIIGSCGFAGGCIAGIVFNIFWLIDGQW